MDENVGDWHEAMLSEPLGEGSVQCHVCPRLCRIAPGKSGTCRARVNRDGVLYAITYGKVCSVAADPIEKKPVFHFRPGSTVLSFGRVGCTLRCGHCQNWQISRRPGRGSRACATCPSATCPSWPRTRCQGVAFTYNEPVIWLEWVLDGAERHTSTASSR